MNKLKLIDLDEILIENRKMCIRIFPKFDFVIDHKK